MELCHEGGAGKVERVLLAADHLIACPGLGQKSQCLLTSKSVEIPAACFSLPPLFPSPFSLWRAPPSPVTCDGEVLTMLPLLQETELPYLTGLREDLLVQQLVSGLQPGFVCVCSWGLGSTL